MDQYHLGINLGHDRAVALVHKGEIIFAIQQERLDRHKHSVGFLVQSGNDASQIELPTEAIHYCLDGAGIAWSDVATITANLPGIDCATSILHRKLPKQLWPKIRSIPSHHLAHAYTAYWPSGFDDAIVLVTDATGTTGDDYNTESYTLYAASEGRFNCLHSEQVPSHLTGISTLGFLYEYLARKSGFVTKVGSSLHIPESGKLMGLAPYGGEQIHWPKWVQCQPDSYSLTIPAYDIFLEVAALEKQYDDGRGKPYLRAYMVDLAYKVQAELETALLHLVGLAKRQTGLNKLCLAGGVALNSVANYRLLRDLQLDDVFAFPAAGDAGIAAGCALWAYAEDEKGTERVALHSAALGRQYAGDECSAALDQFADQIDVTVLNEQERVDRTAGALAKGHIVARFEGGAEYGPRALGQRSILADPTFEKMRDIINARVKFREPFRPFAPVIPEERAAEVFEQPIASPFMMLVSDIKAEYHSQIPSVTHCDGSGRIQTVTHRANGFLHQLCYSLTETRGGPPVVLNTSFNVAGQPIVETPEEAIATFLQTDIDYLCLENFWITKRGHSVLDYDSHLTKVKAMSLPRGLPCEQPSMEALAATLDRAIFGLVDADCPWTEQEIDRLSLLGARYKEKSCRYQQHPFGEGFRTSLSAQVRLILNPRGKSQLLDLSSKHPSASYDYLDIQIVLAVFNNNPTLLETLRIEKGVTSGDWRQKLRWAAAELQRFGLQSPPLAVVDWVDSTRVPASEAVTLAPYQQADFSLKNTLQQLRECLRAAAYTEAAICQLLGVDSLQQIEPTHLHYYDRYALPQTPLANLMRLFLLRATVQAPVVSALMGETCFQALQALGVLKTVGGEVSASVDLFSVDGLYLVTDHRYMIKPEDRIDEDPVMYIGLDSLGLVMTAPRYAVDSVLDLCTGSGIQALSASRYARQVTAVDINPRAIRFARFNAELNGIDNLEVIAGDLYQAVPHGQFDIILANPPFVPSPEQGLKFRDGGSSGERVLARIIAEAHRHLSPSGRLHIVSDLVNLVTYQAKLQNWWRGGPAQFTVFSTADRDELLFSVPHSNKPFDQSFAQYNQTLSAWIDNFRAAALQKVNFGYLLIHQYDNDASTDYAHKVIHSPTVGIYAEVSAYLISRQQLHTQPDSDLVLRVHPKLRLKTESDCFGNSVQVEMQIPDNPFYTLYRVSEKIALLVKQLARRPQRLSTICDADTRKVLLELVAKGLLWVTARSVHQVDSADGALSLHSQMLAVVDNAVDKSVDKPPKDSESIEELASCTTPTCLTSYMQS
ncbi:MAG: methyltransferase [Cellvibrionaceae bacterium]|nr:methyltransferase [Cellvibrionaceae bacterium]